MAIVHTQLIGQNPSNQAASFTVTPILATTLSNAILVGVVFYPPSGAYPTCVVTDSKANTYTVLKTYAGSTTTGPSLLIVAAYNATALTTSDTITATFTGTAPYAVMITDEWSGLSSTLDGATVSGNGGSGSSVAFGTLTTTNATDLVLTYIASFGNLGPTTWSAGWLGTEFQTAGPTLSLAWQLPVATGPFSGTATLGAAVYWDYTMVAIKAAGGAAPVQQPMLTMMGVG